MFQGWKIFERSAGGGSVYEKYKSQMVVVVSRGKKNNSLYIMPKVLEAIGKHERIMLMTRGSNVALVGTSDIAGYKLQNLSQSNGRHRGHYTHIQITKFRKAHDLKSGAYNVHIENGMAVFDLAYTPSQL